MIKKLLKRITNSRLRKDKGFTLLETLVAITILATTVTAPLTIAAYSLFQARYSRDQVVATYLAQESVEMIRYLRDRNLMLGLADPTRDWLRALWEPDSNGKWFTLDWDTIQQQNAYQICGSGADPKLCPYLKYDARYNLRSGDTTKFRRAVRITKSSDNTDEILIESRVYWFTGGGREKMVEVKTYLYNWAKLD